MKINVIEVLPDDTILTTLDIGDTPSNEVDDYVDKAIEELKKAFGCHVVIIPNRGISNLEEFTVIRKLKRV